MDETPFFEFNILDFKERDVEELKKFAKAAFDVEQILTTANELKYTRAIQNRLAEWIVAPSEDFVRLVSSELVGGRRFTPAVRDLFTGVTKRAFEQLIAEKINERLKGAMAPELPPIEAPSKPEVVAATSNGDSGQVEIASTTTQEELEGFYTVRAIVRSLVPSKRVVMRDAQSYCAILLDDNNRRPICRLRFNNTDRLRIGLFNGSKDETIVPIDSVDEIYAHANAILAAVESYLGPKGKNDE